MLKDRDFEYKCKKIDRVLIFCTYSAMLKDRDFEEKCRKTVESRTLVNSAGWGGDREFDDDDDGGEQCELGWR